MLSRRAAVFGVFVLNGSVFGTWAARVPALAAQVGAEPGGLGLSLFGVSVGLVCSAPIAGRLCAAFGARLLVVLGAASGCLVLPVLGLSPTHCNSGSCCSCLD